MKMSEKLCLKWNDFKENVNSAFGKLREDKEFTDVTLAYEDGHKIEIHKVILASSSPFFEEILQKSKHPHPLIYLRGFQSKDFASILDFLYFGEANVYQEDLDSFLAIAEEIKLKGLTGQTLRELLEEQENPRPSEPAKMDKELCTTSTTGKSGSVKLETDVLGKPSKELVVQDKSGTDLQVLDEKVKSMVAKGQKMIPNGKQPNGTIIQATSCICNVCGKEGLLKHIKQHIESNHLEGISIPCDRCGRKLTSRASLYAHKSKYCVATRTY